MSDSGLGRLRFEMAEQPEVVRRLLATPPRALDEVAHSLLVDAPRAIVLVARGSSDHAATYGRYLFEVRNRMLTSLAAPSAFTVYGAGPDLAGTLVIGVSQSGKGEDVTSVLRSARQQGARTLAIVNNPDSPLAQAAQWTFDCGAGPEESVPATKTVLAQMTLLALLSERWRALRNAEDERVRVDGVPDDHAHALGQQEPARVPDQPAHLANLPDAIAQALAQEEPARALAQQFAHLDNVSIVGRGFAYPAALELALKLKEMAQLHASAYSSADFLHGPVTLVGPRHRVLALDCGGHSTAHALETARNVSRRGTEAYLLRAGQFKNFRDAPALTLPCDVEEHLASLVLLVLGQLLATEVARARGLDPANPPGLRKVTSTR